MSKDETPPWPRGNTFYQGGIIDPNNLGGSNFEGKEYRFEDTWYGTDQYITVRVVRNSSSVNLLPGRVCSFDSAWYGNRINGYTDVTAAPGVVLDELLPPAGLVPNDLAFVIMEGPTLVYTALDGGADNVIGFLDALVALTGATSGATTAGRVATGNTSGGTWMPLNCLGRALSAATTGNTNKKLLMNAFRWI